MSVWVQISPPKLYARRSPTMMKELFPSLTFIDGEGLPLAPAEFLLRPDLSAVEGWHDRYWLINAGVVSLMSPAERNVVDAAIVSAQRDKLADEFDQLNTLMRNFAFVLIDELNGHADKLNEILDAIDAGATAAEIKANIAAVADHPQRTVAQLKTAIRNRMDV